VTHGGGSAGPEIRRRPAWAPAALLLAMQAALLVGIARDKADTVDEGTYLRRSAHLLPLAGTRAVPDFWLSPQWAYALALSLVDSSGDSPGRVTQDPAGFPRVLFAARLSSIAGTVVAGLLLWLAARRFGEPVAFVTLTLWTFSPTVLAHGSLVTLDGWSASFACCVLWAAIRFVERPLSSRAAVLGVPLALALATKATAAALVPLAVGLVAYGGWRFGARRMALHQVSLGLSCFFTLWACYAFSVGPVRTDLKLGARSQTVLGPLGLEAGVRDWSVPFPVFWETILSQASFASAGQISYLFGEVRVGRGWWWFYLAALALKTTLGAQVLALLRLVAWAKAPPPRSALAVDVALLLFPVLLFLQLSVVPAQSGIRYLLPAYPFGLLWLGRAWPDLERAFARPGLITGGAAVFLGVAASLMVFPHSLMFFNAWAGGPMGGPRYLVHGDDWGQDQRRLGLWQKQNGLFEIYYAAYFGHPRIWGIRYQVPPCEPRKGVFALHVQEIYRNRLLPKGCLDWLTLEPPDEHIGYSIYLYVVDKTRLQRLTASCAKEHPFWRSGKKAPCPEPTGAVDNSGSPPPQ
jgi:hypothetical protein